MSEIIDIKKETIRNMIKPRRRDAHKGDFGRVLIVAGEAGMTGAAVFAAEAALRSGAGLVYVSCPEKCFNVLQIKVPEAICLTWEKAVQEIRKGKTDPAGGDFRKHSFDAVAFGPGMGTGERAKSHLRFLLESFDGPLVIDADGLNCLSQEKSLRNLVKSRKGDTVITPHTGEAARLLKCVDPDVDMTDREKVVSMLASGYNVTAVLKGSGTLVCRPDDMSVIYRNTTGNPGMATGGTGDALTGMTVSIAGQGYSAFEAAEAAIYLHGLAGDIGVREKTEFGLKAWDVCEKIPEAFMETLYDKM
jgi:NAD(P)H-hydrate epimerase